MATTSLWAVKDNLKRVLDYATNPSKTEVSEYDDLADTINYITDDIKTEKQLFVSGVNCHRMTVLEQMKTTKMSANKTGGVLAFHGYQSFLPNEVTPEIAHKIGIELAEKMWGEDFEVLVSTHLDREHLHNHFVVNSVSFRTRKRFLNKHKDYARMRNLSDELCRKYKLSVIDDPKKGMHYAEWLANKQKKPTIRKMIQEDVDKAIESSLTFTQFIRHLTSLGYEVKTNVKHIAIRPQGSQRFFRLHNLTKDERYSEENIKKRILKNEVVKFEPYYKPTVKKCYYKGNMKKTKKLKGFRALYFCYMYKMGILPKNAPNKKRVHFLLKEELKYMDKITQETTLLCKNKIETIEDLDRVQSMTTEKMEELIKDRKCLYGKIRRCKDPIMKEKYQRDIHYLSNQIRVLRKEVKLYEDIRTRSLKMKDTLSKVNEDERKEMKKDERRRGNRRSSRANESTGN